MDFRRIKKELKHFNFPRAYSRQSSIRANCIKVQAPLIKLILLPRILLRGFGAEINPTGQKGKIGKGCLILVFARGLATIPSLPYTDVLD